MIGNLFQTFIPKPSPEDPWRNRRNLAYISVIFSLVWVQQILLFDVFIQEMDAAKVGVYIGVMTTLQGFVVKLYFDAVKLSEKEEKDVQTGQEEQKQPEGAPS